MAKLNQPPRSVLVRRYLAYRRSLGYRMHGGELLLDFARFADATAPNKPLTASLAIQWACASPSANPKTRAQRIGMVRGFARYCTTFDARTQVPDFSLLGVGFQRGRPHIFSVAELKMILRRARRLETSRSSLHPLTYTTLIGLLASTGMRPGEALRLHWTDLDVKLCSLRIRRCKFSSERVIPLHSTVVRALQRYVQARRTLFPEGEALFISVTGHPLSARRTEKVFQRLARDIVPRSERGSVRLMDFRHTFASGRISQWSRQKRPVAHHLLLLARYLGHRTFNSTWWYVTADPIALRDACARFRDFHEQAQTAR
jgi:integrase